MNGELDVCIVHEVYILERGDCALFEQILVHEYECPGVHWKPVDKMYHILREKIVQTGPDDVEIFLLPVECAEIAAERLLDTGRGWLVVAVAIKSAIVVDILHHCALRIII